MKLNRHNYEEFFILYMDNELSSDERRMVEDFVQQHPDLKDELDSFLQYKLNPDTSVTYTGKESLLKSADATSIHAADYEEWLLLYLDNELTADQKENAENFIAANQVVKKELELLQQTKLKPEQIIFANKESLFRREEKVRTLPVRWWRTAAAILILALGFTAAIMIYNKPAGIKEDIATIPGKEKTTPAEKDPSLKQEVATTSEKEDPVNNPFVSGNKETNNPVFTKQEADKIAITEKKEKTNLVTPSNSPLIKKEDPVMVDNNRSSNDLPQPVNNPVLKNDAAKNGIANVIAPEINTNQLNALTDVAVTKNTTPPSDIINAAYPDDAADFNQPGGKKNKFRGLLRKVTRTFEKRTNIDPTDNTDRLLIGGLAIRMK